MAIDTPSRALDLSTVDSRVRSWIENETLDSTESSSPSSDMTNEVESPRPYETATVESISSDVEVEGLSSIGPVSKIGGEEIKGVEEEVRSPSRDHHPGSGSFRQDFGLLS